MCVCGTHLDDEGGHGGLHNDLLEVGAVGVVPVVDAHRTVERHEARHDVDRRQQRREIRVAHDGLGVCGDEGVVQEVDHAAAAEAAAVGDDGVDGGVGEEAHHVRRALLIRAGQVAPLHEAVRGELHL